MSLTPGEALSLPTSLTSPASPMSLKGGLSMAMLAGGVRGDLVDGGVGGFGLAFKADALWVGTGSEAVDGPAGRLAGTEAVVTRVRTALEASRGYVFGHGIALQPSLELGLRQEGGDAETGAGADVAASLIAADPLTGLSVDVRVRTLLVHQDEGFRERSVSVSFSYDPTPSTPLGFTARVAPSWGGQAMSGADALWGRDTMEGLGAAGPGSGDRIDAELGYALPVGEPAGGDPEVRCHDFRVRARLPAGLQADPVAARHHELRVRPRRPAARELGPGGRRPQPGGPTHGGLVGADGQVVSPARRVSLRASYSGRWLSRMRWASRGLCRAAGRRPGSILRSTHLMAPPWRQLLVAAARTGRPASHRCQCTARCSPSPRSVSGHATHLAPPSEAASGRLPATRRSA